MEEFHSKLKSIIETVGLKYVELQSCMNVLNRIALNIDFYNKMCKIWDSFGIRDKSLSVACAGQIKKIVWLVFIIARIKVLNSRSSRLELVEMVFLLYSVVKRLIVHLPNEVTCDFIIRLPDKDKIAITK